MQVRHHGLKPLLLLLELQFELRDNLHLNPGLGRALIVKHVLRVDVLQEGGQVGALSVATGPLARAVGIQRMFIFALIQSGGRGPLLFLGSSKLGAF